MKIFYMSTMEGVSRVIRPWLCAFFCDQLLHFGHGIEYGSLSTFTCGFASMGESLVKDRVYWFCDYPPGRLTSLIRLVHSNYGRFDDVMDSWSKLLTQNAQLCLWEFIGDMLGKFTVVR